jgi:hypothetical protein
MLVYKGLLFLLFGNSLDHGINLLLRDCRPGSVLLYIADQVRVTDASSRTISFFWLAVRVSTLLILHPSLLLIKDQDSVVFLWSRLDQANILGFVLTKLGVPDHL